MNRVTQHVAVGLLSLLLAVWAVGSPAAQVANPHTYQDTSVFARGTTGDLIMYHWDRTASVWVPENLSFNRGASYRIIQNGNPSAVNSPRLDGSGPFYTRPDVFARNDAGKLIHFFWTPTQGWRARNRTNETGGGVFLGDPVAVVSWPGSPNAAVYHVFGQGKVLMNDGTWVGNRLIHYWSADGLAWHAQDLTGDYGGPSIRGNPDVVVTGALDRVRIDVFARGDHRELVRYWWTPQSGWNRQDWNLTQATGGLPIPGDFDAVHSADHGEDGWVATRLDVYGLHGNELVHYYTTDWNTWHYEPLSANVGGGMMYGGLDVVVSSENGQLRHDVIARTPYDQLLRYTWTPAWGWRPFLVWTPSIKADPVLVRRYRHGVNAFDVFARGTVSAGAGDLIHLYQGPDPTSPTGIENLTTSIPGQRFVGQPTVAPWDLEVFARTSEGHLLRYWYESHNQAWRARDLTTDWAGPTIAGDPVVLYAVGEPPQ